MRFLMFFPRKESLLLISATKARGTESEKTGHKATGNH